MISSFEHHIGTNYVPSMTEMEVIKKFLDTSSDEVKVIDDEITRLQEQLQNLQAKKSTICNILDQHRALISPARRISRDVLEEIFLACLPDGRNPCVIATEAPLLLTHVCSSWRSVAHSLARLWSGIHIVLPSICKEDIELEENLIQDKLRQLEAVAKQWLARSAERPLSISIIQCYGDGHHSLSVKDQISVKEILELHMPFLTSILAPRSNRWFEFDFCLPFLLLGVLLEEHLLSKPALRSLHITSREVRKTIHRTTAQSRSVQAMQKLFSKSTPLTSLSVRGRGLFQSLELSSIPHTAWRQLTELNIEAHSYGNSPRSLEYITVNILRHCRNLKTLIMDLSNNSSDSPWPNGMGLLSFPSLITLSLSLRVLVPNISRFFSQLHLPSLTHLDIEYSGVQRDSQSFGISLEALIESTGHGLEYLGIYSDSMIDISRSLMKCLQMTPNLKHLKFSSINLFYFQDRWQPNSEPPRHVTTELGLRSPYITDDLVNALSPAGKPYSEILCPTLEFLNSDHMRTGISSIALKECIRARRKAHLLDNRISELSQVRMYIFEDRKVNEDSTEDDKLFLGEGSAVYYRKKTKGLPPYSPQKGIADEYNGAQTMSDLYFEAYTDL